MDHEQLRRELTLKLTEIYEQDSRRWNFNFQTETPLPGRLQWEEVAADREPSASNSGDDEENLPRVSNTTCPAPGRRRTLRAAAKSGRDARITGEARAPAPAPRTRANRQRVKRFLLLLLLQIISRRGGGRRKPRAS